MFGFFFRLALLLAVSQAEVTTPKVEPQINYRLPSSIIPIDYEIKLTPTLHRPFIFKGECIINAEVITDDTNNITLHSRDLDYDLYEVKRDVGNGTFTSLTDISLNTDQETEEEKKTDFLIFKMKETLKKGKIRITLHYSGVLNENLRGFYRSSYINKDNKEKRWLATTHFEATSARLAFPCFDEPALKAEFLIKIDLSQLKEPKVYKAISNMPKKSNSAEPLYEFEKTPKMSTYLVAFVISDFEYKTDSPITVWSQPALIDKAQYPLTMGKKILKEMAEYTGVVYQLPKMDQIGIPDFAAGAMENWGLVTYRQHSLVLNETTSTVIKKQGVAGIIAHEFAHQWFGNHVGPAWWEFIWLNEGFATFFQYFITDKVENFDMKNQFVISRLQAEAFVFDVTNKSHPMNVKVNSPKEISNVFDKISYAKSACVIRMMQHFLTEKNFKAGLKNYLDTNKNGYATSDILFKSLNDAWAEKNQDLKKIMDTWVTQSGYPVITVTRDYAKKSAKITQQEFFAKKTTTKSEKKWTIPINFVSQTDLDNKNINTEATNWFKSEDDQLDIDLKTNKEHLVIFNKQQTGYYRVNYDKTNWNLIIKYLSESKNNTEKIHKLNRAQLVDDAWNLAKAGLLGYDVALDLTNYLTLETDYFPWYSAIRHLNFLRNQLLHTQNYDKFKEFGLKISQKLIENVGFEETGDKDHIQTLKRRLALSWVCSLGYESCNKLEKKFVSWIEKKESIPENLKSLVYCEGLKQANKTIWDKVYEEYRTIEDHSQKEEIFKSLSCSRNKAILYDYLQLALKNNEKYQNFSDVIQSVYNGNEIGLNVSLEFISRNVISISKLDKDSTKLLKYINDIGKKITRNDELQSMENFVKIYSESLDKSALDSATNSAKENIAWTKQNKDVIGEILIQKTQKNSASALKFATLFCLIPVFIALFI
ncbi:aminopeptidase N-like [Leptopilina heterotoma]|uniref:aminopeptidase N-like n=1 Tax=Leptopilina heterotoma TaxID=63436 RepID=UPI001CA99AD7|nr:aminopeptidase N-like [Leptopilina heterotoma]